MDRMQDYSKRLEVFPHFLPRVWGLLAGLGESFKTKVVRIEFQTGIIAFLQTRWIVIR